MGENLFAEKFFKKLDSSGVVDSSLKNNSLSNMVDLPSIEERYAPFHEEKSLIESVNDLSEVDLILHINDCLDIAISKLKIKKAMGAVKVINQAREFVRRVVEANE